MSLCCWCMRDFHRLGLASHRANCRDNPWVKRRRRRKRRPASAVAGSRPFRLSLAAFGVGWDVLRVGRSWLGSRWLSFIDHRRARNAHFKIQEGVFRLVESPRGPLYVARDPGPGGLWDVMYRGRLLTAVCRVRASRFGLRSGKRYKLVKV